MNKRRLMTTGEVARELDVHPSTILRWADRYGLRPARVTLGGQRRWDFEDLKRQIRELQASGEDMD